MSVDYTIIGDNRYINIYGTRYDNINRNKLEGISNLDHCGLVIDCSDPHVGRDIRSHIKDPLLDSSMLMLFEELYDRKFMGGDARYFYMGWDEKILHLIALKYMGCNTVITCLIFNKADINKIFKYNKKTGSLLLENTSFYFK